MSPKGPPFSFFDILQQNGRPKNPKGCPFLHFLALCDLLDNFKKVWNENSVKFFLNFFLYFDIVQLLLHKKISPKVPPSFFLEFCDRRDENCQNVRLACQSGPSFGFLGSFRREYFDTLKSFCYF